MHLSQLKKPEFFKKEFEFQEHLWLRPTSPNVKGGSVGHPHVSCEE